MSPGDSSSVSGADMAGTSDKTRRTVNSGTKATDKSPQRVSATLQQVIAVTSCESTTQPKRVTSPRPSRIARRVSEDREETRVTPPAVDTSGGTKSAGRSADEPRKAAPATNETKTTQVGCSLTWSKHTSSQTAATSRDLDVSTGCERETQSSQTLPLPVTVTTRAESGHGPGENPPTSKSVTCETNAFSTNNGGDDRAQVSGSTANVKNNDRLETTNPVVSHEVDQTPLTISSQTHTTSNREHGYTSQTTPTTLNQGTSTELGQGSQTMPVMANSDTTVDCHVPQTAPTSVSSAANTKHHHVSQTARSKVHSGTDTIGLHELPTVSSAARSGTSTEQNHMKRATSYTCTNPVCKHDSRKIESANVCCGTNTERGRHKSRTMPSDNYTKTNAEQHAVVQTSSIPTIKTNSRPQQAPRVTASKIAAIQTQTECSDAAHKPRAATKIPRQTSSQKPHALSCNVPLKRATSPGSVDVCDGQTQTNQRRRWKESDAQQALASIETRYASADSENASNRWRSSSNRTSGGSLERMSRIPVRAAQRRPGTATRRVTSATLGKTVTDTRKSTDSSVAATQCSRQRAASGPTSGSISGGDEAMTIATNCTANNTTLLDCTPASSLHLTDPSANECHTLVSTTEANSPNFPRHSESDNSLSSRLLRILPLPRFSGSEIAIRLKAEKGLNIHWEVGCRWQKPGESDQIVSLPDMENIKRRNTTQLQQRVPDEERDMHTSTGQHRLCHYRQRSPSETSVSSNSDTNYSVCSADVGMLSVVSKTGRGSTVRWKVDNDTHNAKHNKAIHSSGSDTFTPTKPKPDVVLRRRQMRKSMDDAVVEIRSNDPASVGKKRNNDDIAELPSSQYKQSIQQKAAFSSKPNYDCVSVAKAETESEDVSDDNVNYTEETRVQFTRDQHKPESDTSRRNFHKNSKIRQSSEHENSIKLASEADGRAKRTSRKHHSEVDVEVRRNTGKDDSGRQTEKDRRRGRQKSQEQGQPSCQQKPRRSKSEPIDTTDSEAQISLNSDDETVIIRRLVDDKRIRRKSEKSENNSQQRNPEHLIHSNAEKHDNLCIPRKSTGDHVLLRNYDKDNGSLEKCEHWLSRQPSTSKRASECDGCHGVEGKDAQAWRNSLRKDPDRGISPKPMSTKVSSIRWTSASNSGIRCVEEQYADSYLYRRKSHTNDRVHQVNRHRRSRSSGSSMSEGELDGGHTSRTDSPVCDEAATDARRMRKINVSSERNRNSKRPPRRPVGRTQSDVSISDGDVDEDDDRTDHVKSHKSASPRNPQAKHTTRQKSKSGDVHRLSECAAVDKTKSKDVCTVEKAPKTHVRDRKMDRLDCPSRHAWSRSSRAGRSETDSSDDECTLAKRISANDSLPKHMSRKDSTVRHKSRREICRGRPDADTIGRRRPNRSSTSQRKRFTYSNTSGFETYMTSQSEWSESEDSESEGRQETTKCKSDNLIMNERTALRRKPKHNKGNRQLPEHSWPGSMGMGKPESEVLCRSSYSEGECDVRQRLGADVETRVKHNSCRYSVDETSSNQELGRGRSYWRQWQKRSPHMRLSGNNSRCRRLSVNDNNSPVRSECGQYIQRRRICSVDSLTRQNTNTCFSHIPHASGIAALSESRFQASVKRKSAVNTIREETSHKAAPVGRLLLSNRTDTLDTDMAPPSNLDPDNTFRRKSDNYSRVQQNTETGSRRANREPNTHLFHQMLENVRQYSQVHATSPSDTESSSKSEFEMILGRQRPGEDFVAAWQTTWRPRHTSPASSLSGSSLSSPSDNDARVYRASHRRSSPQNTDAMLKRDVHVSPSRRTHTLRTSPRCTSCSSPDRLSDCVCGKPSRQNRCSPQITCADLKPEKDGSVRRNTSPLAQATRRACACAWNTSSIRSCDGGSPERRLHRGSPKTRSPGSDKRTSALHRSPLPHRMGGVLKRRFACDTPTTSRHRCGSDASLCTRQRRPGRGGPLMQTPGRETSPPGRQPTLDVRRLMLDPSFRHTFGSLCLPSDNTRSSMSDSSLCDSRASGRVYRPFYRDDSSRRQHPDYRVVAQPSSSTSLVVVFLQRDNNLSGKSNSEESFSSCPEHEQGNGPTSARAPDKTPSLSLSPTTTTTVRGGRVLQMCDCRTVVHGRSVRVTAVPKFDQQNRSMSPFSGTDGQQVNPSASRTISVSVGTDSGWRLPVRPAADTHSQTTYSVTAATSSTVHGDCRTSVTSDTVVDVSTNTTVCYGYGHEHTADVTTTTREGEYTPYVQVSTPARVGWLVGIIRFMSPYCWFQRVIAIVNTGLTDWARNREMALLRALRKRARRQNRIAAVDT